MQRANYSAVTIIFEGGECAGKSSVVKELAERFTCAYDKRVGIRNPMWLLNTVTDDLMKMQMRFHSLPSITLFDRWQGISDFIYQPMFSCTPSILTPHMDLMADTLHRYNGFIVFLDVDDKTIKQRYVARGGDKMVTLKETMDLAQRYRDFFLGSGSVFQPLIIDTSNKSIDEIADEVVKHCHLSTLL